MTYDRRKVAAAPNLYADELDAGYIAQEVIMYGRSKNWAAPNNETRKHIAMLIEKQLAPFNIGITDEASGTWGHKPGGSHFYH